MPQREPKSSMTTKDGRVRTVVFLPPDLKRELKHAALDRDCSPSDLVVEALKKLLGV